MVAGFTGHRVTSAVFSWSKQTHLRFREGMVYKNKLPPDGRSDKDFVASFNEVQIFTEKCLLKRCGSEIDCSLYSFPSTKVHSWPNYIGLEEGNSIWLS